MTVIIEYVLIENFLIDYFIITCTLNITKTQYKRTRIIFTAILSAIISLTYPLIEINLGVSLVVKSLIGAVIVLISTRFSSKKHFFINLMVFFGFTFLLGGFTFFITTTYPKILELEFFTLLITAPILVVCKIFSNLIKGIYKRSETAKNYYKVGITLDKKTLVLNGFLDSGNALYFNDSPCIIAKKSVALKLITPYTKIGEIEYKTVSGKDKMKCIRLDELLIYFKDKPNIIKNVMMCVAKYDIGVGFDVILHPALLESKNESVISKIKIPS